MQKRKLKAFTLIELLVVVSIIALLISILLPSLTRAKEQAKLAACMANMRTVGTSLVTYLMDLNQIPLYATGDYDWCSWAFGGWSGRNREYWESQVPGWNVQTNRRPLSVYFTKAPISEEVDRFTPTEETPYYKCPSDRISAQWQWGDFDNKTETISAYDDVGTSYQLNFHWWDQVLDDAPNNYTWAQVVAIEGVKLWLGQMDKHPSRFAALIEDPMDWGLGGGGFGGSGIQILGFHGKFSKHVAFFLDGHADYSFRDTRHYHDSLPNPPGPRHGKFAITGKWTVIDETNDHPSDGRHS